MKAICIFEDAGFEALKPLSTTRPVYQLLLGASTMVQRAQHFFPELIMSLHCRDYLQGEVKAANPKISVNQITGGARTLFLNGRVLMDEALQERLSQCDVGNECLFTQNGEVVALVLSAEGVDMMRDSLQQIPSAEDLIRRFRNHCVSKELESVRLVSEHADTFREHAQLLIEDFSNQYAAGVLKGIIKSGVSVYAEEQVYVGRDAVIEDGVVINAENGPVIISEHAHVQAFSRLEGPLFIGAHSQILGARISSSSIGPHCKVGGEVSNSTILGYSNKAHDGYLGHSYVGEWVNLGALTTTSNLKINYNTVSLDMNGTRYDTEETFFGSMIGDHVKTGIGTLLNTGTIVGFGSAIFGSSFHSQFIPNFSWGTPGKYSVHKIEAFLDTAERMMARRNIRLSDGFRELVALLKKAG